MYDLFYVNNSMSDDTHVLEFKKRFPHARIIKNTANILDICSDLSFTNMFWVIKDTLLDINNEWDFSFKPYILDTGHVHMWKSINFCTGDAGHYGSIMLFPKIQSNKRTYKMMDNPISTIKPFDIFFISYQEPNADHNWNRLRFRIPRAQRIHGIKGIDNAHRACAIRSTTRMFWTIDGDTNLDDGVDLSFVPDVWNMDYLHLWYSRNPITGLEYGYGSVKLWPTSKVLKFNNPWLDFTTGVGELKIIEETIATTIFNTSEFESWKSAFRECYKLAENIKINPSDQESTDRLHAWENPIHSHKYTDWCKRGAEDARSLMESEQHARDIINNFDSLKSMFHRRYGEI